MSPDIVLLLNWLFLYLITSVSSHCRCSGVTDCYDVV